MKMSLTTSFLFIVILFITVVRSCMAASTHFAEIHSTSSNTPELSSEFMYHLGPVVSPNITIHIIWYGTWPKADKIIIREFINSISGSNHRSPSVSDWWKQLTIYDDWTNSNVTRTAHLGTEKNDRLMSQGRALTRLALQRVINSAIRAKTNPLPVHFEGGIYLVLTASDVYVDDFCVNVCGFHAYTFPSVVRSILPFAWVGNSGKACPEVCAYPFAVPDYLRATVKPEKSPNRNVGVDGMVSIIAHELAELVSNPLATAWYMGDPLFPTEVGDLCRDKYGDGAEGPNIGQVLHGKDGAVYNMHGVRRRFLVQRVWSYVEKACVGPKLQ